MKPTLKLDAKDLQTRSLQLHQTMKTILQGKLLQCCSSICMHLLQICISNLLQRLQSCWSSGIDEFKRTNDSRHPIHAVTVVGYGDCFHIERVLFQSPIEYREQPKK
jgi:hypothetical protein